MNDIRSIVSDFVVRRLIDVVGESNVVFSNHKTQAPILPPQEYGLSGFQERFISSADGTRIGLWVKPPADASKPTYVAYHGRTGHWGFAAREKLPRKFTADFQDNAYRIHWLQAMADSGAGVVAVHTRGFGLSASPAQPVSESALKQDADAIAAYLQAQNIDARQTIVTGESLGGAQAAILDETMRRNGHPPAMLGLIGTFADMSRSVYDTLLNTRLGPLRPLKWATEQNIRQRLGDPLRTSDRLRETTEQTKLYIAHAPDDEVVLHSHAKRLLESTEGKQGLVSFRALTGSFRTGHTRSHTAWNAQAVVADMQEAFHAPVFASRDSTQKPSVRG